MFFCFLLLLPQPSSSPPPQIIISWWSIDKIVFFVLTVKIKSYNCLNNKNKTKILKRHGHSQQYNKWYIDLKFDVWNKMCRWANAHYSCYCCYFCCCGCFSCMFMYMVSGFVVPIRTPRFRDRVMMIPAAQSGCSRFHSQFWLGVATVMRTN